MCCCGCFVRYLRMVSQPCPLLFPIHIYLYIGRKSLLYLYILREKRERLLKEKGINHSHVLKHYCLPFLSSSSVVVSLQYILYVVHRDVWMCSGFVVVVVEGIVNLCSIFIFLMAYSSLTYVANGNNGHTYSLFPTSPLFSTATTFLHTKIHNIFCHSTYIYIIRNLYIEAWPR